MTTQEEMDPKEAFRKLEKKISSMGISGVELATLKSYKNLSVRRRPIWPKIAACTLSLTLLILAVLVTQWPVQRKTLMDLWFRFYDLDLEAEKCVLEVYDGILDAARPPVDCSVCQNVEDVDRVTQLSPELFEAKYAYSGRPVVITDGMKNWTASNTFTFDFFRGIYTEDSPVLVGSETNCQFFPYKTEFEGLSEVLNMSKERAREPWYIGWSNCDSSAANVLRQHYSRPYFLPAVAESSKTDWIFMGSPGYGATMHIDNVRNPSWQAQITGEKLWIMEPPPECYHMCKSTVTVTVKPGEIFVFDSNRWFHETQVIGDDVSICIGSEYD